MCKGWDAQHDALQRYDPVMEAIVVLWLVFLYPWCAWYGNLLMICSVVFLLPWNFLSSLIHLILHHATFACCVSIQLIILSLVRRLIHQFFVHMESWSLPGSCGEDVHQAGQFFLVCHSPHLFHLLSDHSSFLGIFSHSINAWMHTTTSFWGLYSPPPIPWDSQGMRW